ncbi:MAG: tetratricopeptide repeat protein [Minicystis sp.]
MHRHHALLAALPILLLACSKPAPPAGADGTTTAAAPTVAVTSTSATATASAAAPTASAAAPPAKKPLSRAERAKFLKPLEEGRKKARAKDFQGALVLFDQALAVAPDDARVLAEVGWAALNTGELDRADKANRRALALTKQPALRAQILYNAGRVAEAKKDTEAARKAYAESLALRDNAEVKRRLEGLGGPPEQSLPCPGGAVSMEKLCACLFAGNDAPMMPEDGKKYCEKQAQPALGDARLSIVSYGAEMLGERVHLLVAYEDGTLSPVAELGRDYEPGAFGIHNEARVVGAETRTFGRHRVLVVKSEQRNADQNMAGLELCEESEDLETVCALGDRSTFTHCFTVPVRISSGCGPGVEPDPAELDDDTKAQLAEMQKGWKTQEVKLSWALADDGRLVVKKVSGADSLIRKGLVGVHKLAR